MQNEKDVKEKKDKIKGLSIAAVVFLVVFIIFVLTVRFTIISEAMATPKTPFFPSKRTAFNIELLLLFPVSILFFSLPIIFAALALSKAKKKKSLGITLLLIGVILVDIAALVYYMIATSYD